jgi:hypothetical protein
VLVAESKGTHKGYSGKPVADTIIKLDSVKDRKLLKLKDPKPVINSLNSENKGINKDFSITPATDTTKSKK